MSDKNWGEWWLEDDIIYVEKVDGLGKTAVHVIEIGAVEELKAEVERLTARPADGLTAFRRARDEALELLKKERETVAALQSQVRGLRAALEKVANGQWAYDTEVLTIAEEALRENGGEGE